MSEPRMDASGTDRRVMDGPPPVGQLVALAAPGYEAPGDTSRERRAGSQNSVGTRFELVGSS
jgi:hypothetical protein